MSGLYVQVNWQTYKHTLKRVVFNSTIVSLVFQLSVYPLFVWRGAPCGYELPSFLTVVWQLFVCAVVVEIGFYYTHK